jgi:hypothetical protein
MKVQLALLSLDDHGLTCLYSSLFCTIIALALISVAAAAPSKAHDVNPAHRDTHPTAPSAPPVHTDTPPKAPDAPTRLTSYGRFIVQTDSIEDNLEKSELQGQVPNH